MQAQFTDVERVKNKGNGGVHPSLSKNTQKVL